MIYGVILALLNPIFVSIQNVFSKVNLNDETIDDLAVIFARFFYVIPILAISLALTGLPETLTPNFWLIMLGMIILEIPSQWYYHQSIKLGQLSIVMPIQALIAIPMLTSFVVFGGWSWPGITGAIMIGCGIYVKEIISGKSVKESNNRLKYSFSWKNLIEPFKSLIKNKSSRYMLYTIMLWSITTPLQKIALSVPDSDQVHFENIAFMGIIYLSFCSLGVILLRIFKWHKNNIALPIKILPIRELKPVIAPKGILKILPIGGFAGLATIAQYWSLSFLNPVYVIALKETLLIWTIILDKVIFKKEVSKELLASVLIVIIGAMLVGIAII